MRRTTLLAGIAGCILFSLPALAAHFRTLYSFTGGDDGSGPQAALVRDRDGNLYGTAAGGANGLGVVFKLAPGGTQTVLHAFAGGSDGAYPEANLTFDKDGNLFGTTIEGGGHGCKKDGCGTVFEITPDGTETVLHAFRGGDKDGLQPFQGVILDRKGNLFGTSTYGPGSGCFLDQGCGIVFRLKPAGTEKILYALKGGSDVGNPNSNLVRDGAGNLYGAAMWGGNGNDGGVFRIAPDGTETVLYSATPDANSPAGLAAHMDGNLYTAVQGGKHGHGAILRIAPNGKMSVVYAFRGGRDGDTSLSGVIVDAANNLYGTTPYGGGDGCSGGLGCGTVFRIAADGKETVLHRFTNGDDGSAPFGGLLMDRRGHLYGTAYSGGAHGQGTVFEIDP